MTVKLNGEARDTQAQTVAELLQELNAPPVGVAVAVNDNVVRKGEHATTKLHDGDVVELIRAVQGG